MTWAILSTYGLIGVEHCAIELSYPFGYDSSDLSFDKMGLRFTQFMDSV